MLFKKTNSGSELRKVTGNWFAINSAIDAWSDLLDAQREVEALIGNEVLQWAEVIYNKSNDSDLPEGIFHLQRAIAYLAAIRFYNKTDVSHDVNGRKIKIDADSQKMPWEWQLLDDDKAHLEAHYRALDSAIAWCERTQLKEWIESETRKAHTELFINSLSIFERYYPISGSWRTYMIMVPFIREVERDEIMPVLGDDNNIIKRSNDALSDIIKSAIVLLSISRAIKRLPIDIFPNGIVRNSTGAGSQRSSKAASMDEINETARILDAQAHKLIAKAKRMRHSVQTEVIMPQNHKENKFFNM